MTMTAWLTTVAALHLLLVVGASQSTVLLKKNSLDASTNISELAASSFFNGDDDGGSTTSVEKNSLDSSTTISELAASSFFYGDDDGGSTPSVDPTYDHQTTTYYADFSPVTVQGSVPIAPFFAPEHAADTLTALIEQAKTSVDILTPSASRYKTPYSFTARTAQVNRNPESSHAF